MRLYNKYKSKKFKTFVSLNDESMYYQFLAKWQEKSNISICLLDYSESTENGSLYFVAKCKVGSSRFLVEVMCQEPKVSFAIICTNKTNINQILSKELL